MTRIYHPQRQSSVCYSMPPLHSTTPSAQHNARCGSVGEPSLYPNPHTSCAMGWFCQVAVPAHGFRIFDCVDLEDVGR